MAKISYDIGDYFKTSDAFGIIIKPGVGFRIIGAGGRIPYEKTAGPIPEDAAPLRGNETMPAEVQLALESIRLVQMYL